MKLNPQTEADFKEIEKEMQLHKDMEDFKDAANEFTVLEDEDPDYCEAYHNEIGIPFGKLYWAIANDRVTFLKYILDTYEYKTDYLEKALAYAKKECCHSACDLITEELKKKQEETK